MSVWFLIFDCFGCFFVRDGQFMDSVIFGDFTTFPQCIGFNVLVVWGFLRDLSDFWEYHSFGMVFSFEFFWLLLG